MISKHPILYSFRRCPYAMRARLAIATSGQIVELREVVLRSKPQQLLDISPKGTVPVLLFPDNKIIDESLDIMQWALSKNDPHQWLTNGRAEETHNLIQENDGRFKYYLDRYKYADRYPEYDELFYRKKAERFLAELESRLYKHSFLCSNFCSIADIAIFPFIRQFANVDNDWFVSSKYKHLNQWLTTHINSHLFTSIMGKYAAWQPTSETIYFNQKP